MHWIKLVNEVGNAGAHLHLEDGVLTPLLLETLPDEKREELEQAILENEATLEDMLKRYPWPVVYSACSIFTTSVAYSMETFLVGLKAKADEVSAGLCKMCARVPPAPNEKVCANCQSSADLMLELSGIFLAESDFRSFLSQLKQGMRPDVN